MSDSLPFKISVLVFVKNKNGQHLLLKRAKEPNQGLYSPIGGKLEQSIGESPIDCACRETFEEINLQCEAKDLHLFAMVSEKSYENKCHWLMFLFNCKKTLNALPPEIDEGTFEFVSREHIEKINIPETDRQIIWKCYDEFHKDFVALKIDCEKNLSFQIQQIIK